MGKTKGGSHDKNNREAKRKRISVNRKTYKSKDYGKNYGDKDYEGVNYIEEDDFNSNNLGRGAEVLDDENKDKKRPTGK